MPLIDDPLLRSIDVTTEGLRKRSDAHWIIAFSGGKDSSAVLKIFLAAYRRTKIKIAKVTLIYCDTGVENPILDAYVKNFLRAAEHEFAALGLPISIVTLRAPVPDRFFVRIIGRGYPPPTNSFRWCTTGLRIKPVSEFIATQNPDNTIVVLGLRQSESRQRDRALALSDNLYWQKQREGKGDYDLFLPIVEMTVPEVWDAIFGLSLPRALNKYTLETLYRGASGECPVIKAPTAPPCASGRFGCWTCTVVRKDKSASELIKSGHFQLEPFLMFRDWLAEFRNDPANRWRTRRNGRAGLGPFTIDARKEILKRVDALEDLTQATIIDTEERGVIASLWRMDNFVRLPFKQQSDSKSNSSGPQAVLNNLSSTDA